MPNNNQAKNKKSGGLRVYWLPTGTRKGHKHKKNKYYDHDNEDSPKRAMMSGDSPKLHSRDDIFDFKDDHSSLPPTTSKSVPTMQTNPRMVDSKVEVLASSALAEPLKEHGPGTNFLGILEGHSEQKTDEEILATEDRAVKSDETGDDKFDSRERQDKRDGFKKINGAVANKLDGSCAPPFEAKKEEEEDDNCPVKCLYYTLECCECNIM